MAGHTQGQVKQTIVNLARLPKVNSRTKPLLRGGPRIHERLGSCDMDEEGESGSLSAETPTFPSETNSHVLDNMDQSGLNDISSDSSEQNGIKDELCNGSISSRRPRSDSVARNRKLKVKNDTSHRDIEKRRRDRINRSLWMLKDLVPAAKNRYGSKSGRLEKAELLELTVEYLRLLNKDSEGEPPFSVITPLKSEEDQEAENAPPGLALPQDLYIAGFKDGVLEVLSQLKKNAFLSDFQAQDIVSRVHARDSEGNVFNVAQATGVMDALGLSHDMNGQLLKPRNATKEERDDEAKGTDVDSGCQGISDEDSKPKIPPPSLLRRKRRQNPLDNYETDSLSSDNSSERSCGQRLSPKRPYLSSSTDDGSSSTKDKLISEPLKKFPEGFESFPSNSALAALHGCPLLLPAYALHASGTRYVPIVLPPSAVFGQGHDESLQEGTVSSRTKLSEQQDDYVSVGQPPVLVRSGSALYSRHSGNREGGNTSSSDQERHHSASSAPTSVISMGKSSDSCSDDEVERQPHPPRGQCLPAPFEGLCSSHSKRGIEKDGGIRGSTETRHRSWERALRRDELSRSSLAMEYHVRATEPYNPYLENHSNLSNSSVLHYFQSKYSHKGLYR